MIKKNQANICKSLKLILYSDPIRKCRTLKKGVYAAENCTLDSQYNGLVQLPEDRKKKQVSTNSAY